MRSLILAIVLASAPALAQAPGETPPRPVESKSLLEAYLISIAATSLPIAATAIADPDERAHGTRAAVLGSIAIGGLVLGPSAGQWYAGKTITTGLVLRASSVAAIGALAVADPHLDHVATVFGLIGAVGVWEVGVIWDAVTLPRAIREANRAHALYLAPIATTGHPGLAIGGTF